MEDLNNLLHQYNRSTDFPTLQKCLKRYPAVFSQSSHAEFPFFQRVAVLSNYSTQFVCGALRLSLLSRGVRVDLFEDEFNQWELSIFNSDSALFRFKPDSIVFLLSSIPLAYAGDRTPDITARKIAAVISKAQSRTGAKILLCLPEALAEERGIGTWAYEWRQELLSHLQSMLPNECIRVSLDPLIRVIGARDWYSQRHYVASKLPFHPNHTKEVADVLADPLRELIAPRVKLVVVDLDNTLWHGIVGELGSDNVDLNPQERGYAHLRLQRLLSYLSDNGVLLAINSKNNFEDAIDVFRKRPEMILKESSFAAIRINWESKSSNLRSILDELKLSSAGVVFLDDTPFERAEVRQAFPDLIVPELEMDPVKWTDQLLDMGIFYRNPATQGDKVRLDLYKTERRRQEQRADFDDETEFLASLGLRLRVRPLEGNEQRVLELIAKTNQFNLTARRHERGALRELLRLGSRLFVYELEDKFGSYGIISVVIARPTGPTAFIIDTWLMSCRVIGRRVERGVLCHVISELEKLGAETLVGEFIPTAKNGLVRLLYEDLGFAKVRSDEEGVFYEMRLAAREIEKLQHFCKIETVPAKLK